MKKILPFFLLCSLLIWKANATTSYLMGAASSVTVDCSTSNFFFDDGGSLNAYSNSLNKTETFTSSSGLSLKFKFTSFSTQQGNDILTIYDGPTTSSTVIGQFSGSNSPGTIFSSTNSLTFVFSSNSSTTSTGWAASISCVSTATLYSMTNNTTISTCNALFRDFGVGAGGAGHYGTNQNMTETFTSSTSGYSISFTFDSLNLGSNDALSVYDGTTTISPLIKTYSGSLSSASPNYLLSSSGSLTFKFTSDGSGSNAGWYGVFDCEPTPVSPASTATWTMPTSSLSGSSILGANMVTACSGTLADNGGLSSNYSSNINSIYRVFCPNTADNCLRIQFYSIGIHKSDELEIVNSATKNDGTAAVLADIGNGTTVNCASYDACMAAGYGPYTSYDPSGCLSLTFTSDGNNTSSGFSATLSCVPCASGPSGLDNNDCTNATPLCSSSSFTAASLGPGLVSEAGSSCVLSENYTNWYSIKFSHSGTLGLTLTSVGSDDYDFALYGPGVSCGSLGSPIRCSYYPTSGATGMKSGEVDVTETASTGNGYVSLLNVNTNDTYYLMVSKFTSGGDGFTLSWALTNGATLDCSLLPVTLTSFACQPDNNMITLDWTTEAEVNNDHYIVERSSDGENYSVFTTMPGKGTTTMPSEYFVADYHPLPGDNYYRLSQVDKDGNEEILKTTVCSSPISNEEVTLRVFDMSGRLVYTSRMEMSNFESTLHNLDLPTGVYVAAVLHANGSYEISKYLKLAQGQ